MKNFNKATVEKKIVPIFFYSSYTKRIIECRVSYHELILLLAFSLYPLLKYYLVQLNMIFEFFIWNISFGPIVLLIYSVVFHLYALVSKETLTTKCTKNLIQIMFKFYRLLYNKYKI